MLKFWGFVDWIVLFLVTAGWGAGTAYLFMHPSAEVFVAWCGLAATMTGVYHWLTLRDAKVKDSE